ncbi:MAG TPA: hypothetical protein VHO84_12765 [Syntrophorhabdaceae bacterium]|nr:hypothetical protein [Syntrophorhabdaceae bacterium]
MEATKRGMKGKCPGCYTVMAVPQHSMKRLIFDVDQAGYSDTIIHDIASEVHESYGDKLIRFNAVKNKDEVVFEVKTDECDRRSQSVRVTIEPPVEDLFEYKTLVVSSKIGRLDFVESKEVLIDLIKSVNSFETINFRINQNEEAELVSSIPLGVINVPSAANMVMLVANLADDVESLAGVDVH